MNNRIRVLLIAAALLMLGLSVAQAETYKVDPVHSVVHFHVEHMSAGIYVGRFNSISGTVDFDEDNPANSSVEITIQADSVDTNNERRDNHIKSPDFLNAAQFPTITFKSKSIEKTGDDTYEVTGDLTIRGITKEITTEVRHIGTSNIRNKRIGFVTEFDINRRDFEVNYGEGNVVGDTVTIALNIEGMVG